ncbi:MAG: MBL fold metallo-hydrolase, partial [Candidatus Parcubacteria bacterium]|nr:MBL fold metallo-hydrolase [Candidatus Parcubacteria bacterium]
MNKQLAQVKILLKGYFQWLDLAGKKFKASSTVTLIRDGRVNILVDTGHHQVEKKLIAALKREGLKPNDIHYVIVTHHHPDHVANNHLFKRAIITDVLTSYKGDQFKVDLDLLLKGKNIITPNVYIISTPGHELDECTVIAKTEKGSIAIVGDLFWAKQKEKNIMVKDKKALLKNQARVVNLADYIIPGHAGM